MSRMKKVILLLGDILTLYLALALTLFMRYGGGEFKMRWENHLGPFSLIFVAWLLVFVLADLYRQKFFRSPSTMFVGLVTAVAIAILSAIVLFYLFGSFFDLTPKTNLFLFSAVFLFLGYAWRIVFLASLATDTTPLLFLGESPLFSELVSFIEDSPQTGYHVFAWIKNKESLEAHNLQALVRNAKIHGVVVQPALAKDPFVTRALYALLPEGVALLPFPDFYELIFDKVPLEELSEDWFLEHIISRQPFYDAIKRVIDFFLASFSLVVLSPVAFLAALFIKISSPGPVIFSQERAGKNDRVFALYKFRTMNTWQGGQDGTPAWTEKNDPRITSFGKILRFTHLDEIPQLWNIVRGDISFTGPRPERSELAARYSTLPYYEMRHVVKPGLTGWAQINYRPSASIEEAREKLTYDIYYVKERSLVLDILIILKTIKYFFRSTQ